jgi:hypothetical protein
LVLLLCLVCSNFAINSGSASSTKAPDPISKLAVDAKSGKSSSSESDLLTTISTINGREDDATAGKTKTALSQAVSKQQDSLRIIIFAEKLLKQLKKDLPHLWKLYLVFVMMAGLGWRIFSAWREGNISVPQGLLLVGALFTAEVLAVGYIRSLDKIQFALMLAFPVAALIGLSIIARTHDRESRCVVLRGEVQRCQRAIACDPRNAAAHEFLGDTYLKLNKPAPAINEYRSALALSPGDAKISWKLRQASHPKLNRRSPCGPQ